MMVPLPSAKISSEASFIQPRGTFIHQQIQYMDSTFTCAVYKHQ